MKLWDRTKIKIEHTFTDDDTLYGSILVRTDKLDLSEDELADVVFFVGYSHKAGKRTPRTCLISFSDGYVNDSFLDKSNLIDYLNAGTYRYASKDEAIRVMRYYHTKYIDSYIEHFIKP